MTRREAEAWALGSAALALLSACPKSGSRYFVERIEWGLPPESQLPLSHRQIEAEFLRLLRQNGTFQPPNAPGEAIPRQAKVIRLALELDFAPDQTGRAQVVAAALSVRRRADEVWLHQDFFGRGLSLDAGATPESRSAAASGALEQALSEVVTAAGLELRELDKSDRQVIRDLADPKLKDAAIDVLTERRNPAAADPLLEKLKLDDPYQVRRAMGGLVALREKRAVPLLIDIARDKDWGFLRELLFAIGELGGEDAEGYLYTVASGHDEPAIRDAAKQALEELAARERRAADASTGAGREGRVR